MGSLVEELRRREAAACGARAEADRLRSRIEELAEELARADEQVYRLSPCPGASMAATAKPYSAA